MYYNRLNYAYNEVFFSFSRSILWGGCVLVRVCYALWLLLSFQMYHLPIFRWDLCVHCVHDVCVCVRIAFSQSCSLFHYFHVINFLFSFVSVADFKRERGRGCE